MKTKVFNKSFILGMCVLISVGTGCKKSEIEKPVNPINPVITTEKSSPNTVYIDPAYTGVKMGTMAQPYTSWIDVKWTDGLTCLIKAGSVINVNYSLRPTTNRVTVGSYGTGNRPHIISTVPSGSKVLDLAGLTDMTARDLEIESTNYATCCINFMSNVRSNVINCKVHGGEWGIRNLYSKGWYRIINSEVYNTGDDGCFTSQVDSVELSGSYIHDVNQKYFINPAEAYSGGDVFQMVNVPYFNIHNNTLDHGITGNKFCIIAGGDGKVISKGIIEYNTLVRKGNILLYMQYADNVIVRYNKFQNAGTAIYNLSTNAQIYYNEFSNISGNVLMMGAPSGTTRFTNNTFYNFNVLSNNYTNTVVFKNNIFSQCYGTLFVSGTNPNADYNCYNQITNMGSANIGAHSIKADPLFNNVSTSDLCLKGGSPCIGKGINLWVSGTDIAGIAIPNSSSTDIGDHQFSSIITSNASSPVVTITSPANGESFTAPATFKITANASDVNGSVAKVEFFNGSVKLGESTTAPYVYTCNNLASAIYTFAVVATNNLGIKTTSSVVTAWVNR